MPLSSMPIDTSSCDRLEIRFPGAIMPHGSLIVLDKRSHKVIACAENICDYLGFSGKYAGDIKTLMPEEIWLQLRKHKGGYLDRFTLANSVVIDIHSSTDDRFVLLDIERIFGPTTASLDNPIALLKDMQDLLNRITHFDDEKDIQQVAVNTVRELIGYDMVQFVLMRPEGSMQTSAESSNGHYHSFLDKRFSRSDVPDPARKIIDRQDTVYVPDIDYTPIPIMSLSEELDPENIDLSGSSLRSLSPLCNRFYLNVGVHAKLMMTLTHKNKVWGMVIAWNNRAKSISPKNRLLCRYFLDTASRQIMVNRELHSRNTFITHSNYVDDFLDELQRTGLQGQSFSNLTSLLLKIIPCCGAAIVTNEGIYKAGLSPENDQLRTKAPAIRTLCVQNDHAAFYIQEPYKIVRLSGFMALPLIDEGSYIAVFRREEVETVTWAGDPKKPVSVDETSGMRRLPPRGSFQAWKEEVKNSAKPWERLDIDIFQRLVNGLNTLLAKTQRATETSTHQGTTLTSHVSNVAQNTESKLHISGINLAERTLRNTIRQWPKHPSALIIESDFLSATHIEELLQGAGITAETPPNPQRVDAFLEHRQYDIVFIAIENDSVAWQPLIKHIKHKHPSTHCIALCNRKPFQNAQNEDVSAFITRPIIAAELYQRVINCCS
jgi:two-component system, chemotaxis family, sensor kinase Cph1